MAKIVGIVHMDKIKKKKHKRKSCKQIRKEFEVDFDIKTEW